MIRALTPQDIDAFIEIRMLGLKTHPEAFGAAYEEGIDREKTLRNLYAKNDEDFILGYFAGDFLVGIVGFLRYTRLKMRHKGWIWGMYVRPQYHGRGIGKALMETCMEKASALEGLQKVTLSVTHTMIPAKRLYESVGFLTYGVEKDSMRVGGNRYDEILMSRETAAAPG
jgi:ribosomal protein S18 acetylase RimI-like enzyme